MQILTALAIDLVIVATVSLCMSYRSPRHALNPGFWWMALHLYTVTFRLISLMLGSQSMWEIGIQSNSEYVKAAAASDISLIAVLLATLVTSHSRRRRDGLSGSTLRRNQLSRRGGWVISALCLLIGGYALIKFGYVASAARESGIDVGAVDLGRMEETALPITIAGFAVQGALIQCAMYGFTRLRSVILISSLILSAANLARTASVLAILLALLIYLTRRGMHSIPQRWILCLMILGAAWFVQKPIVSGVIDGKDVDVIMSDVQRYVADSSENKSSIDTQFLDMQATYMASADEIGKRYYGATLLPLVYLPIPRFLWPDKPRVNQSEVELSSQIRQIMRVGMIATLSGESYINFGWIGTALIPFLYMYLMQSAFVRVETDSIRSTSRWVYLIFLVCMVQVFRDGLNSLVTFGIVTYFPLMAWAVISKFSGHRRSNHVSTHRYGLVENHAHRSST